MLHTETGFDKVSGQLASDECTVMLSPAQLYNVQHDVNTSAGCWISMLLSFKTIPKQPFYYTKVCYNDQTTKLLLLIVLLYNYHIALQGTLVI